MINDNTISATFAVKGGHFSVATGGYRFVVIKYRFLFYKLKPEELSKAASGLVSKVIYIRAIYYHRQQSKMVRRDILTRLIFSSS